MGVVERQCCAILKVCGGVWESRFGQEAAQPTPTGDIGDPADLRSEGERMLRG